MQIELRVCGISLHKEDIIRCGYDSTDKVILLESIKSLIKTREQLVNQWQQLELAAKPYDMRFVLKNRAVSHVSLQEVLSWLYENDLRI